MGFEIRRRQALMLVSGAGAALSGCSTARPAGSTLFSRELVKPAGFKLANVQLRWQENGNFGYRVSYKRTRGADTRLTDSESKRATAYMRQLGALFRERAVPATADRLLKAGVTFGTAHTLVLVPLSGDFDMTGGSSGIVVRAMIQDANRKTLYLSDIDSRSSWTLLGLVIPDPDAAFVDHFVDALVATFKEAGLLE
ncbi:hypothetical protein [Roseateles sp.]|uniref:hypothetical protein n=1 Tax=Roseateles sp. TaxID=1971397 RepID=UPI0032638DCA